jgi:predicted metal-dependent phosphotriesterase family hydrolase
MAPRVMTVSGPIPPEKLGFTLPHEHTGIDLWHIPNRWDYWELTADEDVVADELRDFRRRGGASIVDLTLDGVGRDPHRLRRLASVTGLNVVMGAGWYREAYYPAELLVDRRSVDDLADLIVREWEDGVGETGVRPGIIGEIGTDKPWVSAREERVHRAAARAALRTGMAITTHGVQSAVGLKQLAIFVEEGVDPARVVIGHADSHLDLEFYLAVLDRGANLQFDFIGHRFGVEEALEPRLVETIVELLERGHAPQLLLSQDVCHNRQLKAYGGFGYVYLHQHFLPTLRTAAVGEGEIRQMTIDNPARVLTVDGG